jgi:hypothetical protein
LENLRKIEPKLERRQQVHERAGGVDVRELAIHRRSLISGYWPITAVR